MSNMQKKFFATAFKFLPFATFAIFLTQQPCAATPNGNCAQHSEQKTKIRLAKNTTAHLDITSCGNINGRGHINTTVYIDGKIQKLKSDYDSDAYSIDVNSSIDLNNDGIPDLGISNGKGRGGDGMHYWIFNPKEQSYIDAGEAPFLQISTDGKKTLFTAVTSSGEIQSIRYNYIVSKGTLKIKSAIGFIPTDNNYVISFLKIKSDGSYQEVRRISGVDTGTAQGCMNGSIKCKFNH